MQLGLEPGCILLCYTALFIEVYLVVHNLFYETLEKGKQVASNAINNDKDQNVFIQNLRSEIYQFGIRSTVLHVGFF